MPHLLKRIELAGFKSFAEKTVLEFPSGITGIVGPNGSGKSNVIDAIRWLLGEREAKHLRGGKSEDLIFAGTPKRPRTSLAQASLHFDNHSRFFPVDFEEVSVMRQVSRDGTNQYFVNGSEVRLKDLIDFFTSARLGSRGITVVTQGNSDMFIRATPEDRRSMIEEVLGLKEFQLKRTEAERRLKNAESNLGKAKALMEEILPHLRSLKRQTSRFEKRDEYASELRSLEDRFFGFQIRDITRKLAAAAADLRAHESKEAGLRKAAKAAEEKLAALEANEPKGRGELKALKETMRAVEERRAAAARELTRLETRLELAAEIKPATGISGEKLLGVLQNAKRVLEDVLQDPVRLRAGVEAVLGEIDALFHSADKREEPMDSGLKEEFARMEKSLRAIESEMAVLTEKEKELETGQEDFYRAFKAVLAEVQEARRMLDEWTKSMQSRSLEHERLAMRKDELERKIAEIGRRPEEFHVPEAGDEGRAADGDTGLVEAEHRMFRLRGELAAIGEIDEAILREAKETEERYAFLERESADLAAAEADLRQLIRDLTEKIATRFEGALGKINTEFHKFFELMFGGGTAKLVLEKLERRAASAGDEQEEGNTEEKRTSQEEEEQEEKEPGIEIKVSLPRKRVSSLDALSGGERSLVGIATLFALVSVSPPPFLVLDEIDAPLDERNARKFSEMLREFSKETQFILVTHNRATMESADVLYGVTLGEDGASKVLSVKLGE